MLKIWKIAADFQNVYRYCVSLLVGSVGGRFRTHLQPCRWKRITFCGRYLCFSFTFQRASAWATSWEKCGCWLLVSLTKCGCCSSLKEEINAFSKTEKTISKSSDKTSSTRGSSDAMFLVDMICTQTPGSLASENSGQMIRFNLFRFLSGKKVQFHLSRKKTTENSIQMVSAQCLAQLNLTLPVDVIYLATFFPLFVPQTLTHIGFRWSEKIEPISAVCVLLVSRADLLSPW